MANKKQYDREIGELSMEIRNLKDTTERIEKKLDKVVDDFPKIYATKEELCALKEANKRQDEDIKWTKERVLDLIIKAASVTAIIGFGAKASGLI